MLYALFLCFISLSEDGGREELRGGSVQPFLEHLSSAITSEVFNVCYRVHSTRGWCIPTLWGRASILGTSPNSICCPAFLTASYKSYSIFHFSFHLLLSSRHFHLSGEKRWKIRKSLNFLFSWNTCASLCVNSQDFVDLTV